MAEHLQRGDNGVPRTLPLQAKTVHTYTLQSAYYTKFYSCFLTVFARSRWVPDTPLSHLGCLLKSAITVFAFSFSAKTYTRLHTAVLYRPITILSN